MCGLTVGAADGCSIDRTAIRIAKKHPGNVQERCRDGQSGRRALVWALFTLRHA